MKNNNSLNILPGRFELKIDDKICYADYRIDGNIINIDYVFAPVELRGTGAAGKLMEEISEYAKKNNQKLFPICGYAKVWLKKHSKYDDLIA